MPFVPWPETAFRQVSAHLDHMAAFIAFRAVRRHLAIYGPMAIRFQLETSRIALRFRQALAPFTLDFCESLSADSLRSATIRPKFVHRAGIPLAPGENSSRIVEFSVPETTTR